MGPCSTGRIRPRPSASSTTQQEIPTLLRTGLIAEAELALPEGPAKAAALDLLRELVALTHREA